MMPGRSENAHGVEDPKSWRLIFTSEEGQASLEYLLVGLVVISAICALGALWRFSAEGGMEDLVVVGASHALEQLGGVVDVALF